MAKRIHMSIGCLLLALILCYIPAQAADIGKENSTGGFIKIWSYANDLENDNSRVTKATLYTGENQLAELQSSIATYHFADGTEGTANVIRADEEHAWEEGAGFTLKFSSGFFAYFEFLTIEMGITEGAPKTWKLQFSIDGGKSYADIEGAVVTFQNENVTEVIFDKMTLPDPRYTLKEYHDAERLSQYVYNLENDFYEIRMVAVSSEKSGENWEGNTAGELCIKDISLHTIVAYPEEDNTEEDDTEEDNTAEETVSGSSTEGTAAETELAAGGMTQEAASVLPGDISNTTVQADDTKESLKTTIQVKKTVALKAGKSKRLKVSVTNSKGKKILYRSKNKKIVKVNNKGKITGVKAGTAKVVVRCNGTKKVVKVKVK